MGNSPSADLDGTEPHRRVIEAMESEGEKSQGLKELANPNSKSKDDGSPNPNPLHIHRVHVNKIPLNILEKRERGRIQGLLKFFGYPLLSHERVKLQTSNFVGTFIGSIGTKAH